MRTASYKRICLIRVRTFQCVLSHIWIPQFVIAYIIWPTYIVILYKFSCVRTAFLGCRHKKRVNLFITPRIIWTWKRVTVTRNIDILFPAVTKENSQIRPRSTWGRRKLNFLSTENSLKRYVINLVKWLSRTCIMLVINPCDYWADNILVDYSSISCKGHRITNRRSGYAVSHLTKPNSHRTLQPKSIKIYI